MEEKESETKSSGGGVGLPYSHLCLPASCWRHLPKPRGDLGLFLGRGLRWACGRPARLRAPLGRPAGLVPSPQGSPGKAETRLEHFRVAMTSVLVLEINAPQTRQCGQGLRTYCKHQPGLPIFVPVTLWGAGPGQPLPSAHSSHRCIQGKALAWTFLIKLDSLK